MQKTKFDENTVKNYLFDLINAISYLQNREKPIIHRDIKPENIMLDSQERLKLIDFGFIFLKRWSNFFHNSKRTTYVGTPEYLAPEIISKQGHDKSLDIWSIGVLAFELLTGKVKIIKMLIKRLHLLLIRGSI